MHFRYKMMSFARKITPHKIILLLTLAALALSGCGPNAVSAEGEVNTVLQGDPSPLLLNQDAEQPQVSPTPLPARKQYQPGELVDYTAQNGDTLPALAAHFNTTVKEILAANTFIPETATTLPPGMPMQIPIYYLPDWGSSYQILPDSMFVNGPTQVGFDTRAYISQSPGWLNGYYEYASGANRSGSEIVDLVAQNYSISPQLLLALLEFQSGALTENAGENALRYPLGIDSRLRRGLYLQLLSAADMLNQGYYSWRNGKLSIIEFSNTRFERPDPWQNAATIALHHFFSQVLTQEQYNQAVSPDGLAGTFRELFGNPWTNPIDNIPGSLQQPEMLLPFEQGKPWSYTGGPHTAWGSGQPWAAIDFAPPSVIGGCQPSDEWVTATAAGIIARSETGIVELDLDGDGDTRTGWTVFYLHVGSEGRVPAGLSVQAGDKIGHPSCEGGRTTGTHVHIARKYNGEWILAEGPLAFNLEGWVAYNGALPYQGTLRRFTQMIEACDCSNQASQLVAGER